MKICNICKIEQPLKEYYKKTESKDGKHIYCKTCMKKEKKSYYKSNPRKEYFKTYRKENKEYFNTYCNNHYHTKKELYREWERNRYQNDMPFRIKKIVSVRIHAALKTYQTIKEDKTIEYLGCSIGDYCNYLEQQFTKEMNWGNYGKYWEIDHILPIASFDLNNTEEMYKCFHYNNTQPLSRKENREKSDKILI